MRCWNKRGEVILGTGWSQEVELVVRPQITHITKSNEGVILTFNAMADRVFEIQGSIDLVNWIGLQTINSESGMAAVARVLSPNQISLPPQQNLWVVGGSGSRPRL